MIDDDGEEDDYDATKRRRRRRRQQKRHRIIWLLYLVLITTSLFFLYSYTSIITDSKRSNNIIIRTNIIFANNTTTGNTTNNIVSSQQQQQSEPKPEPKLAVDQSQSQNQQHNGLLLPSPPLPLPSVMMVPSPVPVVPVPVPPLVIGAGAGSTGTHTMYCGTYLLGLPSVHWKLETDYCKSESNINTIINTDNNNNNITFFGGQQQLQQWQQEGRSSEQQSNNNAYHHKQLVNKVFRMHKCLDKRNKEPCPHSDKTNNMIKWMEGTKKMIDKVTSWHNHNDDNDNNNIGAIHDTPYIEFLPYVIESATKNRNGQIPIILLSERNPIEWTERRTEKHPVILCRIDLLNHDSNDNDDDSNDNYDDDDDANSSVTTSISTIATTSHFDWFSCIERTVHAKKEKLLLQQQQQQQQQQQGVNIVMNNTSNITVNVRLSEVFTTYINLCIGFGNPVEVIDDGIGMMGTTKKTKNKEWFPDELKSHISSSFDAYQNNVLNNLHVDYHVNMFDKRNNTNETRISHKTVALEVQKILLLREQQTR